MEDVIQTLNQPSYCASKTTSTKVLHGLGSRLGRWVCITLERSVIHWWVLKLVIRDQTLTLFSIRDQSISLQVVERSAWIIFCELYLCLTGNLCRFRFLAPECQPIKITITCALYYQFITLLFYSPSTNNAINLHNKAVLSRIICITW